MATVGRKADCPQLGESCHEKGFAMNARNSVVSGKYALRAYPSESTRALHKV